jgi:hypothetical protein
LNSTQQSSSAKPARFKRSSSVIILGYKMTRGEKNFKQRLHKGD